MEMDESRSCIEPILLAEQDRIILRQYRANRDEETKLMKDVPGWKLEHGLVKKFLNLVLIFLIDLMFLIIMPLLVHLPNV